MFKISELLNPIRQSTFTNVDGLNVAQSISGFIIYKVEYFLISPFTAWLISGFNLFFYEFVFNVAVRGHRKLEIPQDF